MLPRTVQSTEDFVTIITLLVKKATKLICALQYMPYIIPSNVKNYVSYQVTNVAL